ncbi:MAG: hypothetical protein PHZ11_09510 [Desulfitobacteriaceae bacterium]|nr:hypothetical protein [Desulfitobacteriaceae bacterium]
MLYLKALKGLTLVDLEENILDPTGFLNSYDQYGGTNKYHARQLLNKVLNDDEKVCIINCLHGKYGWYRNVNGVYTNKLKLTADLLGFTNSNFHYDPVKRREIVELGKTIYDTEQKLLTSIYLKQKLVTYKTLIQWRSESNIKLYRGLKKVEFKEDYPYCNLDSWTSKLDIAKSFATQDGYILFKEVPIEDIFICSRSVYTTEIEPNRKAKKGINIEDEYIIEHRERLMPLISGKTIFKHIK